MCFIATETVDLWRKVGIAVWSHVRLKRNPIDKESSTNCHNESEAARVRSDTLVTNGQCEEQGDSNQQEEIEVNNTTISYYTVPPLLLCISVFCALKYTRLNTCVLCMYYCVEFGSVFTHIHWHTQFQEFSTITVPVTDTDQSNPPLPVATTRDSPRPHRTNSGVYSYHVCVCALCQAYYSQYFLVVSARCTKCQATFTMLKRRVRMSVLQFYV